MEKEQVAVDEAVETVAEENARAYSKTVWDESTPITADKLNKIEDGIANALDTTTGGTVKGKLTVKGNIQLDDGNLYSNKNGGNKAVIEVFGGDKNGSAVAYSGGALTVLAGGESGSLVVQNTNNTEEYAVVSADQGVKLYANLQNGWENRKVVEFTPGGRFKLHNNSLELSPNNGGNARIGIDGDTQDVFISNINNNWFRLKGDKTITYAGNKVYTSFDKPTAAEIGALALSGGTLTGTVNFNSSPKLSNDKYINSIDTSGAPKSVLGITTKNNCVVGSPDLTLRLRTNSATGAAVFYNSNAYPIYHTGNKPTPADIGAMPTSGPTFEGNLYQNGPGGKDWIYHINADRGTLNIAPRNNGNPDWGKQIFIDRNGQLHCNGNRRVATINQENPAHHIIRYGAGMGGENGYITFSW